MYYLHRGDEIKSIGVIEKNDRFMKVPWLTCYHRGYTEGRIPDNTLQSIYNAWRNGADMVEVDVLITADGIPVLSHESTVVGIDGTSRVIANTNYDELEGIVLADDPVYGICKVPSVEDALMMCKMLGVMVNLHGYSTKPVQDVVSKTGMNNMVLHIIARDFESEIRDILAYNANASFLLTLSASNIESVTNSLKQSFSDDIINRIYFEHFDMHGETGAFTTAQIIDAIGKGYKYYLLDDSGLIFDNIEVMPAVWQFAYTVDIRKYNSVYLKKLFPESSLFERYKIDYGET